MSSSPFPDHQAIIDRLERGERKFASIEESIAKILAAVEPIPDMKANVDATKEIVQAWDAVKTGGRFLKWVAGLVAAIGVLVGFAKGVFAVVFFK